MVLERERELDGVVRAQQLAQMALAAYLSAAGQRLVADAAEHARTRTQFGRAIGEFQAVAHPLADCHMRLSAASALARAAACELADSADGGPGVATLAAAARLSASAAALEAAHTCHQVFGAIGITLEGPAFHVTRRIRQLASLPPGAAPARAAVLDSIGLPDDGVARNALTDGAQETQGT
jgi:alkylation response protein AidB-like acyl-CoA dehydrogenase